MDFLNFRRDLIGFYIGFCSMLVLPISSFFLVRSLCRSSFNYDEHMSNVFSMIAAVLSVWTVLFSYIIYYFKDDCAKVWCKKTRCGDVKAEEKKLT